MIWVKMIEIAEAFLGMKVNNRLSLVLPTSATRSARRSAPAAIAYGLDKKGIEQNVFVFDLVGVTFDVSLLTIGQGVFDVISTSGDTHLGGEDFDFRIIDYMLKMHKNKTGKDCSKNKKAVAKLHREVERVKRALWSAHQMRIEI
jgi:heat shock protein 5